MFSGRFFQKRLERVPGMDHPTHDEEPHGRLSRVLRAVLAHVELAQPKVLPGWASASRLLLSALGQVEQQPTSHRACGNHACGARLLALPTMARELAAWLAAPAHQHEPLRFVYAPQVSGFCSVACWWHAGADRCPLTVDDFFDL